MRTAFRTGFRIADGVQTIVLVPSAIDVLIAIEDFFIDAFMHCADAILFIIVRGHVEDEDEVAIPNFPFEGEDALVGIIGHEPLEVGGIMFLEMHRGFGAVDEVEVADKPLNRIVFRET